MKVCNAFQGAVFRGSANVFYIKVSELDVRSREKDTVKACNISSADDSNPAAQCLRISKSGSSQLRPLPKFAEFVIFPWD